MKKNRKLKTKKLGRYAIVSLTILLAAGLVAGSLLSYFGKIETTATATQMVKIDGKNWDYTITHSFTTSGGCCECFKHTLKNNGCVDIWLTWNVAGSPDLVGISVIFSHPGPTITETPLCPTCPPPPPSCPSCDCDNPPMNLPFKLKAGQSMDICICYKFANMIAPGVYTITATLLEAQVPK